jgi:phage gp36-like protein
MYVEKTDYRTRITMNRLDLLTEKDPAILEDANKFAIDIISGHLGKIYDLEGEFTKTLGARNGMVLIWAINIATYLIYQRAADNDVPEKVIKNYDDTLKILGEVSNGKRPVNLVRLSESSGEPVTMRRIGSLAPRSHSL